MVQFFIGSYTATLLHVYLCTTFCRRCLAFACAEVLQEELNSFLVHWNGHKIRPSRNADSPSGYPDDMYDMPEFYG